MKIDLISEENSEYVVVTKAKLDKQSISAIYLLGVLHNPNHTCVCVCVCYDYPQLSKEVYIIHS